jgi:hypothetical protein
MSKKYSSCKIDKDLDTALDAVIQWHIDQMNTDYNEYGEPESSINDDFYLENPDA